MEDSVKIETQILKIVSCGIRSLGNTEFFVISRFCFAEDDKEMYQELAQPLHCLLKLFVYRTSRSRLRRGFLKLPIITSKSQ